MKSGSRKNEKLYDMPFEKRIRIKYLMFGMALALSFIGLLGITELLMAIMISFIISLFGYDIEMQDINGGMSLAIWSILIPLACWLWYSKKKPIKHPELNETLGLKDDWDKVKGL